jgi:hypothetical protein
MPRASDEAKARDEDLQRLWASPPPGAGGSTDPGEARSGRPRGAAPSIWWAHGFDSPIAAATSGSVRSAFTATSA